MKYSLDYSVFKLEFFANFYVVLMSQKLVYIYQVFSDGALL